MIKETVNDEEISNSNRQHSFGKLNFLKDSIKDILFNEHYLALLKEKISKLKNGQLNRYNKDNYR